MKGLTVLYDMSPESSRISVGGQTACTATQTTQSYIKSPLHKLDLIPET